MTDMSSSIRMSTSTRVYLYVSLSLIAAIVLVPLLTTALGGFKTLVTCAPIPSACRRSGNGRTIPIFFSVSATGCRSAIRW